MQPIFTVYMRAFTRFISLSWLLLASSRERQHILWVTLGCSLPIQYSSSWQQRDLSDWSSLSRIIWACSAQHNRPVSFWEWAMHQESEVSSTLPALSLNPPLACGGLTQPRVAWDWGSPLPQAGVQVAGPLISHSILFSNLASLRIKDETSGLYLLRCFVFLLI